MSLISWHFLFFTLASVVIYHFVHQKYKLAFLLVCSFIFYALFDVRYLIILAFLTAINYWLAQKSLDSCRTQSLTIAAICLNLAVFFLLRFLNSKYTQIIFSSGTLQFSDWILPIGFSFYLLQLITFQIEIRKGLITSLPGWEKFSLYLVYFPKLLAGPIEKPSAFFRRVDSPLPIDNQLVSRAIGTIFLGLVRKVFIANFLLLLMPDWSTDFYRITWFHVIGYSIYLYNDFAGYTNIVQGVSLFFGIELSPNFQQPFFSRNFSEIWNRWHISLSTWLKETIFFPVSRSLHKTQNNVFGEGLAILAPPFATMLASGFWHGASTGMLFWGALQAGFLVFERILYQKFPRLRPQMLPSPVRTASVGLVFILFCLSMVPFASNSILRSVLIWRNLFSPSATIPVMDAVSILMLGSISFLIDVFAERSRSDLWWSNFARIPQAAVIALGLMFLVIASLYFSSASTNVFVYQTF